MVLSSLQLKKGIVVPSISSWEFIAFLEHLNALKTDVGSSIL